jgi:surface antigen
VPPVSEFIYLIGASMPAQSLLSARSLIRCLTSVVLVAGTGVAFAANLNFLKDTPVSYMKDADRKALNDAAQIALERNKDGESLNWSNSGTGNSVSIHGTVTPRDTVKDGDKTCRTATLVAIAKGQTQSWTPVVCKEGAGPWKIRKQ